MIASLETTLIDTQFSSKEPSLVPSIDATIIGDNSSGVNIYFLSDCFGGE
jgi:hypothetical protein